MIFFLKFINYSQLQDPVIYLKSRKIAAFEPKDKEEPVEGENNLEEDIKELDN